VWLERLHVKNFRNYSEATIDLRTGVSVFVADNGSGKTNVLEAVYYLSQLESHRLGDTQTLIRRGASNTQVIARVREKEGSEVLEVQLSDGGRRALSVNRGAVSQARKFRNKLRTVLFAPEDLDLVRGDASYRRNQLDQFFANYWVSHGRLRAEFDRALKQRNSLLKEIQKSAGATRSRNIELLADWDDSYTRCASKLLLARHQILEVLKPELTELYKALTDSRDDLTVVYQPKSVTYDNWSSDEAIKEQLQGALMKMREVELIRGITMVGPHRDEIEVSINNLPTRTHASQGEAWSVALVWRVAEFDLLAARYDDPPVLLLDDVFTQLDSSRRELLVSRFPKAEQVLITTAVASDVPNSIWNHSFQIKEGEVIAVS